MKIKNFEEKLETNHDLGFDKGFLGMISNVVNKIKNRYIGLTIVKNICVSRTS